MTAVTITLTIFGVVLAEVVGFLIYEVIKMKKSMAEMSKDISETIHNLEEVSRCVLTIAKTTTNIDVVEERETGSTDFTFPGKEGF